MSATQAVPAANRLLAALPDQDRDRLGEPVTVMSGKPQYTDFTILAQMENELRQILRQIDAELPQIRDTIANGPLWGDNISAASFAVSSALHQIDAELQRMRGTLSRGPLWDDINAVYLAVSSALHQIDAELYSTHSRRQLWDDINAAYLAVSSALGKIEAEMAVFTQPLEKVNLAQASI